MKSFKEDWNSAQNLPNPAPNRSFIDRPKIIPFISMTNESRKQKAYKVYKRLELCLNSTVSKQKTALKNILKGRIVTEELKLTIQKDYWNVQRFIFALNNLRVKKLQLTLENFTLFHLRKLKTILVHLCTSQVESFAFIIKCPNDPLDFFLMNLSTTKFTDKHFSVLSRQIRTLPKLESLEISFHSQAIASLSNVSLNSLSVSIAETKHLSSLKLKLNIKSITDQSLHTFAESLIRKNNIRTLDFSFSGFRTVSPDNLFTAISRLYNLNLFYIEIDCGWSEPAIKDLATCCSKLLNLKHFYVSYTPLHRMAFNPLFCQALNKLIQLETLMLILSSLAEGELFELFDSLQHLNQLQKLKLYFVCTDFNAKNINRFSASLAKLQNLNYLCLEFSQCTFQMNSIENILQSLSQLSDLTQFKFSFLRCKDGISSNILNDFFGSLRGATKLDKFNLTVRGQTVPNQSFDASTLSDFIRHHKNLRVFELDLPKTAFKDIQEKTIDEIIKKYKKSFTLFSILLNETFYF